MNTLVAMHQDQGDREYQQDAMARKSFGPAGTLCVLADGMGGYEGGEIASNLIIEKFRDMSIDSDDIGAILDKNLLLSNESIAAYKEDHPDVKSMGSTVVAFFITNVSYQWISVGDSPLYVVRDNKIERINDNHSISGLLELQFKKGEITQKELDENPNKHMLTSAMTGEDIAEIDLSNEHPLKEKSIFILASDGIETLSEEEIYSIVKEYVKYGKQEELNNAAKALVDAVLAKKKPNQDNVTVILVSQKVDTSRENEIITNMIPKEENVGLKNNMSNIFKEKTNYILLGIVILLAFITWLIFGNTTSSDVVADTNKTMTDSKNLSMIKKDIDKSTSNVDKNKTMTDDKNQSVIKKDIDKNISKSLDDNKGKTVPPKIKKVLEKDKFKINEKPREKKDLKNSVKVKSMEDETVTDKIITKQKNGIEIIITEIPLDLNDGQSI